MREQLDALDQARARAGRRTRRRRRPRSARRRPRRPRRRVPRPPRRASPRSSRTASPRSPRGPARSTSSQSAVRDFSPATPSDVHAARDLDHLGNPVAADEGRVEPLERQDARPRRARDRARGPPSSRRSSSSLQLRRPRGDPGRLAKAGDVGEHLRRGSTGSSEITARLARQPGGDRDDVVVGDGADLADRLGDDQVRLELAPAQARRARRGGGPRRVRRLTAASISPAESPSGTRLRVRWGVARRLGRVVALVGDRDDLIAEAEGE